MRSLFTASISVLLSVSLASSAAAQAAKFAAAWETDEKVLEAYVASDVPAYCIADGAVKDPCVLAETVLATIDVAQQKDLLIGVSGQIGLHTFTQAKGKSIEPSLGKASAAASVKVTVELRDPLTGAVVQTAAPGPVIFAARVQELSVDVSSTDTENLTEVVVGLMLQTTAAHHFNFIGVDLMQGDYDVVAVFDLSAFVDVIGEDAVAQAKVTLGPRMVTAQEVKAAKGALVPYID